MSNLASSLRFPARLAASASLAHSSRILPACLALALSLSAGCRGADGPPAAEAMDLSVPADLTAPMVRNVTIRELNDPSGIVKTGDRVRFSGVVITPQTWVTFDTGGTGFCYFRIMLMQADGSPTTIRDGIAVTLGLKAMLGDMSHITECSQLAKMDTVGSAMFAAKLGDEVEIEGKMSSRGSGATATRQVDVFKGELVDKGAAVMMPVPLEADPMTYVPAQTGLTQAFADAQGVLVTFKSVTTNTRDKMYQDFSVNTGPTGGARIATNFLRVANSGYMSPAEGAVLPSITGIVTGDFKGTIWPRNEADIVK